MDNDRVARRRPDGDSLSTVSFLPRAGPKLYAGIFWWVGGLYCLFLASAPYTPTPQEWDRYSSLIEQARFSPEMQANFEMASGTLRSAERDLNEVHVFFWRWRSPYDKLVPPRQLAVDEARAHLNRLIREREDLENEAKASLGIWSQHGVDEVRSRFWKAYESGKDFAKRMTWWDVILGVGGRRDEEAWVTLLRWVGQIMMNFTIGLISALFSFMFSLFTMLWEYKASYLSGALFFFVAMSGASAMVATFIGGMVSVAVGGVYAVAKSASNNARLNDRRRGGDPRFVRQRFDHDD